MRSTSTAEGSRRPGLAVVGVVMTLGFGLRFPGFLSVHNFATIALASAFILIAAIGTMALLVSGHVDLSIGSQYALGSVVVTRTAVHTHSLLLAILTALALGAVLGAVNGLLVLLLDVTPLIVTLGTLGVYGGVAYAISHGQTVSGVPQSMLELGSDTVLGIPLTVLVALALFVAGAFVLNETATGLRLFAVGSNASAAALVGVPVRRLVIETYATNGALIGIVAVLSSAQLASGDPGVGGVAFTLNVLTAVILGGVAFGGGRGHPIGVFVAVAVIAVLNAGLIYDGLDDWWQQVAQGSLLLIALTADQLVILRRERRIRLGQAAVAPPARRLDGTVVRRTRRVRRDAGVVLEAKDVTVRFAGVVALDDVSLTVSAGEIVCLVGDNGAGKSTLAKAICGAIRLAGGEIRLDGAVLRGDPGRARRLGVETVFQDLALCPNLSIPENLVLGREPIEKLVGMVRVRDVGAAERAARTHFHELGVQVPDLRRPVRLLSGGERQLVQILRVMRSDAKVVVLDEPTTALGLRQAAEVRDLVRTIAAAGTPVLLITHDVEEVFEVAHRVVVLQRGTLAFDGPIEDVDRIELLRMMSGKTRLQAAQILEAVSSERKRIERDLHDGAQQGLVTSALMINMATERLQARTAGEDEVLALMQQSQSTLQAALAEMRSFSRGLQAGVLEREGLVGAIRVLTDRAPVLVELRAGEVPRLVPAVERAAYFVVAEALTNALKYAEATRILIEVDLVGDEVHVGVDDDGIGFDEAGDGTGLSGLRERAAGVGGELGVETSPGLGTRVRARFPTRPPVRTASADRSDVDRGRSTPLR